MCNGRVYYTGRVKTWWKITRYFTATTIKWFLTLSGVTTIKWFLTLSELKNNSLKTKVYVVSRTKYFDIFYIG